MSIELMRRIDYWLGIPLCFLLNVIDRILRFIVFVKKKKTIPQKILFIKLSEIGAIILAYPLIKQAKKEFPESEIFFITFEKNEPLFEILGIVSRPNILSIREKSLWLFILDTLLVLRRVRKEKIDIAFDLEFFSRFTAILTYLSKANKRIGFFSYNFEGLYRGNLLTHNIQYNPLIHISRSYFSLWQAIKTAKKVTPELGKKIEDKEIILPRFTSSEEARKRMWTKLKEFDIDEGARLFLVNPGEGSIPLREWPIENFIALSRRLLEDGKNYIIVVGIQGVSGKAELLCKSVNNKRCLDLTHKTTLSEILNIFNVAVALITNDCGLAHIASLTSIKKFVFFGPENPQIYSPLGENTWIIYSNFPCSPCLSAFNHRNSACKDNKCLQIIKPDEVYRLIEQNL
jgi:ADP-heptose:LPS heptosyltransferase